MQTRRNLIGAIISLPAVSLFGDIPERMGASVGKAIGAMVSDAAKQWVADNTRQYNLDGGMMGRGRIVPVSDMLCLVPTLKQLGFSPWATPSGEGMSRIIPIYGTDGSPTSSVWHCFTRSIEAKRNDIVAFEHTHWHLEEFYSRTGLTLNQALEQA